MTFVKSERNGESRFFLKNYQNRPLKRKCCRLGNKLACDGEREGRVEEEKQEPVEIAKDFNFQMVVIFVMFKSTIEVISTTTTTGFAKDTQLQSLANTFFAKLENLLISPANN